MIRRRDFIGSVIATVVGSGMPFKALRGPSFEPYGTDPLEKPARILDILRASESRQLACRMLLRTFDGEILRGPDIKQIERDSRTGAVTFIGDNLQFVETTTVQSYILINDRNQLVCESFFNGGPQTFLGNEAVKAKWLEHNPGKEYPHEPGGDTLFGSLMLGLS